MLLPHHRPVLTKPDRDQAARDVLFRIASRDTRLASVRYRALIPACALQDSQYTTALCSDGAPSAVHPRVAIGVKPLRAADAAWVVRMRDRGVPTVVDICDNIFVEGYGGQASAVADGFRKTVRGGLVTVPTEALRAVVRDHTDVASERIMVVPDIVEDATLLRRQACMLGARAAPMQLSRGWNQMRPWAGRSMRALGMRGPVLLWFGNHGANHANFGLDDLCLWEGALRDASLLGAQLWVVSNHHERFRTIQRSLPISARYFEWSPDRVDMLLALADVCLVPNSLDDFSRSKSPNRALKALAAGVPVVATPTPAMLALEGGAWLGDPAAGIRTYLEDRSVRDAHLAFARRRIEQDFSMDALRQAMAAVMQEALARG